MRACATRTSATPSPWAAGGDLLVLRDARVERAERARECLVHERHRGGQRATVEQAASSALLSSSERAGSESALRSSELPSTAWATANSWSARREEFSLPAERNARATPRCSRTSARSREATQRCPTASTRGRARERRPLAGGRERATALASAGVDTSVIARRRRRLRADQRRQVEQVLGELGELSGLLRPSSTRAPSACSASADEPRSELS